MSNLKGARKVICLILSVMMMLSATAAVSAEEAVNPETTEAAAEVVVNPDENLENYQPAVSMALDLDLLDIKESGYFEPEAAATRNDLGTALGRMLGNARGTSSGIADVTLQKDSGAYITAAVNAGYMRLYTDGNFHGSENITYKEAVMALIKILGYENLAVAKGGYPNGYNMVISEIGLAKGIKAPADAQNATISRGQLAVMVKNALETTPLVDNIYTADGDVYMNESEEDYLSLRMNIITARGVIEATSEIYTIEAQLEDGHVIVDGREYLEGESNISKYAGYFVEYYYDNSETAGGIRTIYHAHPYSSRNKVLEIDARDVISMTNSEITYDDGTSLRNKSARVNFDNAVFVYNGRPHVMTEEELANFTTGKVKLINNTNGSGYNVVIVYSEKNYVVNSVNIDTGLIIFKSIYSENAVKVKDSYTIEVDAEDDSYHFALYRGNLEPFDINILGAGDVLSVAISADGTIKRLVLSEESVSGTIEEVKGNGRDKQVLIGENWYYIDPEYVNVGKFDAGENIKAYLNYQNEIVFYETTSSSNMQYGYIIETAEIDSAMNNRCSFRIYAFERVPAEVIVVQNSGNIKIKDGTGTQISAPGGGKKWTGTELAKKFSPRWVSASATVDADQDSTDDDDDKEDDFDESESGGNVGSGSNEVIWQGPGEPPADQQGSVYIQKGTLVKFRLNTEGEVSEIMLPLDLTTSAYNFGRYAYIDETQFLKQINGQIFRRLSCFGMFILDTTNTMYLSIPLTVSDNDSDYRIGAAPADNSFSQCEVYDMRANMKPKVVVMYKAVATSGPSGKNTLFIVDNVAQGISDEGEPVWQVEGYLGKAAVSYTVDPSIRENYDAMLADGTLPDISKVDDNVVRKMIGTGIYRMGDSYTPASGAVTVSTSVLSSYKWPWTDAYGNPGLQRGDMLKVNTNHLGNLGSYKIYIDSNYVKNPDNAYRQEASGAKASYYTPSVATQYGKNNHPGNSKEFASYVKVIDVVDGIMVYNPYTDLNYPLYGNQAVTISGKTVYVYNTVNDTVRVGSYEEIYPGSEVCIRSYQGLNRIEYVLIER